MTQHQNPRQRRILMVDDELEPRTLLGLALISEGYAVSYADTGAEAVQLHSLKPFDLIIVELFLDEKDGFQTLVQLRRHPTPFKLIVTAKENWLSTSLCMQMAKYLGAQAVLTKPVKAEQLLAAVRTALNNGHNHR